MWLLEILKLCQQFIFMVSLCFYWIEVYKRTEQMISQDDADFKSPMTENPHDINMDRRSFKRSIKKMSF